VSDTGERRHQAYRRLGVRHLCGPGATVRHSARRGTLARATLSHQDAVELIDLPVGDGLLALDEKTVILGVEDGALDVIAREAADRFE
jgi:hypothetical protein